VIIFACLGSVLVWATLRVSASPRLALRLSSYYAASTAITTCAVLFGTRAPSSIPATAISATHWASYWATQWAIAGLSAGASVLLVSALLSRQKLLTRQLRNERWGSFFTATAGAVLITEFGSATAYTAHSSFVVLLALAAGIGFIGTSVLLSALRESARLSSAAAALPEGSSHDYDLSRAFLYLAVMTLCLSAFAGIL
jgi:hypothetical protein